MLKPILLSVSVAALAACTTSLAPQTPVSEHQIDLPMAYDYAGEVDALAAPDEAWWQGFETARLDTLMSEALTANQSLAQGLSNLRASRAALRTANAAFLPQASGSLSASSNTEGDGLDDVDASARLSASYQLDLFGANAASVEGAEAWSETA